MVVVGLNGSKMTDYFPSFLRPKGTKCGDAICGTYINLCEITKFPCKLAQVSKTFRIFAPKEYKL